MKKSTMKKSIKSFKAISENKKQTVKGGFNFGAVANAHFPAGFDYCDFVSFC